MLSQRPVPESFERARVEEEAMPRGMIQYLHLLYFKWEKEIRRRLTFVAIFSARANSGPGVGGYRTDYDAETTFMTNDTFVEQPAPVPQAPAATATDKAPKVSGGSKGPKIPVRGTKSSRVRRASGIARGRFSTR